jgi:hypothetical protein
MRPYGGLLTSFAVVDATAESSRPTFSFVGIAMSTKRKAKLLGFIPTVAEIGRILARCTGGKYIAGLYPNSCWLWGGTIQKGDGRYGKIRLRGRYVYVHRVVWAFFRGPIPAGKVIDHDGPNGCHNSTCCNPAHLRCITDPQNVAERNTRVAANTSDIPF